MTTENSDDEFETISQANHNKIISKMENMGYKDGMHDGQESQFQNGFDSGYEQGFRNGFLLGKYKGSLNINRTENASHEQGANELILQCSSRGHCVVCVDGSLKDSSIKDIIKKQTNQMEKIENTLISRYGTK